VRGLKNKKTSGSKQRWSIRLYAAPSERTPVWIAKKKTGGSAFMYNSSIELGKIR